MSSFSYYDLLEMFAQPGCAICRILQRDVHQLLDSILYEYVTDPAMQNKFRASRGLCNEHGWQLTQFSNALGTAILYEQAVHEILTIIEQQTQGIGSGIRRMFAGVLQAGLADALEPVGQCPVCTALDDAEARYVRMVSDHLGDEKLLAAYRPSEGVCLVHFRQLLRVVNSSERAKTLIEMQQACFQRLRSELLEFMRKNDFQHVEEDVLTREATSWKRAITELAGSRGIFASRRKRG